MVDSVILKNNGINVFNKAESNTMLVGYDEIEILIESLGENTNTITELQVDYKSKEALVSTAMAMYANLKMKFTKEQINTYREYIACAGVNNKSLDDRMIILNSDEKATDLMNEILQGEDNDKIYKSLKQINDLQTEIIHILCDIITTTQKFLNVL